MKRIIIKVGTNLLTDQNQQLDLNNMRQIVYQICTELHQNNQTEFILVSSGAITSGAKHIDISTHELAEKQAAASIGQILLYQQYYDFFQTKGICVGQLLVTKDNFDDPVKNKNIKLTIETLLHNKVIPIINENDSVSTEEIQFGDNDQLSATLAINMNASELILLTNTDGLLNHNKDVIQELHSIGDTELSMIDSNLVSQYSKGGMKSKLIAAQLAMNAGIVVTIANGRNPTIIRDILSGKPVGTKIKK
jgi:glutamate 5-kinase